MDDDKNFKYSDMQFKAHYYGLVHTLCVHYMKIFILFMLKRMIQGSRLYA